MPNEPTEKSKWPSPFSPGKWITARQYILEIVCKNKGAAQGSDLPVQFWKLPEWKKFYSSQLRQTKKLCDKYGDIPVVNALTKNQKGKRVWSLHAQWLIPIIEEEKKKYEVELSKRVVVEHERIENPTTPTRTFTDKLLEDLDG